MGDVLVLQSEVARAIANQIAIQLTPQEQQRLAAGGRVNTEAYDDYLKGRYEWNRRTAKSLTNSVAYFEQAIATDPNYALAYAGLADSYIILGNFSLLRPEEAFPKAKAAARKALRVDNSLAQAQTALAFVTYLYDWDWPTAEEGFKRAISQNPNYGPAHQWYGVSLASRGRSEEAIAELKRAQEVEPDSMIISAVAAWVDSSTGRYDQGVEQSRKTLELDPDFVMANYYLGLNYEQKGMYEEAIAEFQKALREPRQTHTLGALGHAYALAGKTAEAHKLLNEMVERYQKAYFPPFQIAVVYAGLGENSKALEWLKIACDQHYPWVIHLNVDPQLSGLRSDPRFEQLARRVGLPSVKVVP